MAWTSPVCPNLTDFFTYCYLQGIPASSIPLPTLQVVDGGTEYATAPLVTISPPTVGLAMTATATVAGGVVTALTPVSPGTNYAAVPMLTIAPSTGVQATGVVASLGSEYPAGALSQAIALTIEAPCGVGLPGSLSNYVRATYNLGVHLLLELTPDIPPSTFFQTQRQQFGLNRFRPGIVMASGDQSTSQTFIVPQFFQEITLEALEATRTPWGRQWVSYQQMYGQTVFDVS